MHEVEGVSGDPLQNGDRTYFAVGHQARSKRSVRKHVVLVLRVISLRLLVKHASLSFARQSV